jgi:hypothetical protein
MLASLVMIVDIADSAVVDMIHAAVVVEVRPIPVSAVVAETEIPKSIVDATVKSDVPSPVPMVKAIRAAIVTPVSRGPQRTDKRRFNPASRNPVVAIRAPRPVSRSPQVIRIRSWRLVILRNRRRRIVRLAIGQIALVNILGFLVR